MENYSSDEIIRQKIIREKRIKQRRRRIISTAIAIILTVTAAYFAGKFIGAKAYGIYNKEPKLVMADVPIVNVAKEHIGNVGGDPFWSWYGFEERTEWCACFVSWCADKLGYIEADKAPKFALVGDGIGWFRYRDQWLQKDVTPSAGDYIFFNWEEDDTLDHVGLVSAVVDDKIFTIEGNSGDRCRVKVYDVNDKSIYGYGHLVP